MTKPIEWSPHASIEYSDLIEYLINRWSEKVARNFINRLQEVLDTISKRPNLYQSTGKRKNVRRCVISKHASLYYRVKKDKIELITLFDTRQHPLKKRL